MRAATRERMISPEVSLCPSNSNAFGDGSNTGHIQTFDTSRLPAGTQVGMGYNTANLELAAIEPSDIAGQWSNGICWVELAITAPPTGESAIPPRAPQARSASVPPVSRRVR